MTTSLGADSRFEERHDWPRLPEDWSFGEVVDVDVDVAVDGQDRVCVFNRGRQAVMVSPRPHRRTGRRALGRRRRLLRGPRRGLRQRQGPQVLPEGRALVLLGRVRHRPCGLLVSGDRVYIGQLPSHLDVNAAYPNIGACVTIHDLEGNQLARLGGAHPGEEPGEYTAPHGLAVDLQGDLYVARSRGAPMAGGLIRRGWCAAPESWSGCEGKAGNRGRP